MKIFKTLLPISIGTLLFISYFFVTDKLSNQQELESCERYELSTSVYLIFALAIILISSLYEVVIGEWILKRNFNTFLLNIFNSVFFAVFFTLIIIGTEVFNGKTIEVKSYAEFFLIMLLLGMLFLLLKNVFEKISNKV